MDRDNNANNAIRSLFRQKKSKNIKIKKSNPIKKKKITKNVFINLSSNKNKKIKNINAKNKKNKISLSQTKSSSQQKLTMGDNIENNINKKEIYDIYQLVSKHTDTELNSLPYKLAINLDKRSYCIYYVSLIKTKHLVFFSFLPIFDYNSRILKIFLFFFNFTVTFIINALFFNDDTMHKIYVDHGSYDFIYNIPQILYSSIISGVINGIIKILALSYSSFMKLKNNTNKKNIKSKSRVIINILKIKFVIFFIINLLLLIMFWFYLACFCAVYKNTQIHLIKDTLISFGTSMVYPFFIYLIPGIFRIYSINRRNKEYVYKISKILELL